jgi:uncharacterized cupredoxin-like copper-binding protein
MCLALAGCRLTSPPTRDVVLVARGMAFYLEGDDRPNPDIHVRAGERVRLVLKNEAPGLVHDTAIPEWGVALREIRAGERAEIVFDVPGSPGRVEYVCRPHAQMMRGQVVVGDP